MMKWIRQRLNRWYIGPTLFTLAVIAGLSLVSVGVASLPAAELGYQTGRDCQDRLNHPAPLTTPDRAFLERCVSAFTLPTTSSSPAPSSSTAPPTSPPLPTPPTTPPLYPNLSSTGTPSGWAPLVTRSSWTITQSGTYQDIRVNGSITVAVAGVTLRRVEVLGGRIWAETSKGTQNRLDDCNNGLVLDQVTVKPASAGNLDVPDGAVGPGGYTANRVKLLNVTEGFRSGGRTVGCGPIRINHSIAVIRGGICHCDGLQVYDGAGTYVDGLTIDWSVNEGTTAFFAPSGEAAQAAPVEVRHLLLKGGGYALTDHIPGFVEDYAYVAGSAEYSAMSVDCSIVQPFSARIVTIDSQYQVTSAQPLACGAGRGL